MIFKNLIRAFLLARTADKLVAFNMTMNGPVDNIGVDNGDPLDLASTKLNLRKASDGKCLLILQNQT